MFALKGQPCSVGWSANALLLFMTGFLAVINNVKRYCGNWSRLMETKVFRLLSGTPDYDLNTALKIIAPLLHNIAVMCRSKLYDTTAARPL